VSTSLLVYVYASLWFMSTLLVYVYNTLLVYVYMSEVSHSGVDGNLPPVLGTLPWTSNLRLIQDSR
jgi:hypothetical protein